MRVVDRFPTQGFFKGPRTLNLRSLPARAKLTSLKLTITPVANGAIGPGSEVLTFPSGDVAVDPDDRDRSTGVTRRSGTGPTDWTELSLGGFRTLAGVSGTELQGTLLQVDIGGLFVSVDANGTIPELSDPFDLPSDAPQLPGLSVQRMRLVVSPTALAGTSAPVVNEVTLRAVASNVTVSLGDQPAAWALPGELSTPVTTRDLAELAQAALDEADIENGFAILPITIKTDTTASLSIAVEAEFHEVANGLPNGLPEMTLDYAHDGTADAGDDLLVIQVPTGMELDPGRTRIEIAGQFDNSEISHGAVADRTPQDALKLAPGHAAAAPVSVEADTVADAVDVLLSTTDRGAEVKIDLREDFDGKPGDASLLRTPATATLDVSRHSGPRWLSAALGQPVTLSPSDSATGKPRIWVVVQSTAGTVEWNLNAVPVTSGRTIEMQASDNGGLSWRPARVSSTDGGLAPQLRLRRASPVFKVPLSAEIGRGAEAETLSLKKFQPLGRIEFALDSAEVSNAVNAVLADRRAAACPRGEILNNGGFADRENDEFYTPEDWTVSTSSGTVGRRDFQVSDGIGVENVQLLRIGDEEGPAQSISQVLAVSAGCPYRLLFRGFHIFPGARVELIWRTAVCGVSRVDELNPPEIIATILDDASAVNTIIQTVPVASMDIVAPEDAEQAELRVWSGPGDTVFVDALSLQGQPSNLKNPDFREFAPITSSDGPFLGWIVAPDQAFANIDGEESPFSQSPSIVGTTLANRDIAGRTLVVAQRIEIQPGQPFVGGLETVLSADTPPGQRPVFGAVWYKGEDVARAPPLVAEIDPHGSGVTRLASTVPASVSHVELRIEIPPGAALTVIAIAADIDPPEQVPISFLSEAPGRLNVRDFTVGFRSAPAPAAPVMVTTPCSPTPSDAAPGDVCELDPCCGKSDSSDPQLTAASASILIADRPPNIVATNAAVSPSFSVFGSLPAASATARMSNLATRRIALGPRGRVALSVEAINGVGEIRAAQLSTLGIITVADLARVQPGELVRKLDYSDWLARDLVTKARARIVNRRFN